MNRRVYLFILFSLSAFKAFASQQLSQALNSSQTFSAPIRKPIRKKSGMTSQSLASMPVQKQVSSVAANQQKAPELVAEQKPQKQKVITSKKGLLTDASKWTKVFPATKSVDPNALVFVGVQESEVSKNNFLCQGAQFSGSICSQESVDGAVGFDISGGKTLQIFNNFSYWIIQKQKRKEYIKENLRYDGQALENKLNQEGWGVVNPFCILVSTDPMLQKAVLPNKVAPAGTQKVIVQLLYSGNNLIQLWSQDVVFVKPGQRFKVEVSSEPDVRLALMIKESKSSKLLNQFLAKLGLDQTNRNEVTYNQAGGSPRMVRLKLS